MCEYIHLIYTRTLTSPSSRMTQRITFEASLDALGLPHVATEVRHTRPSRLDQTAPDFRRAAIPLTQVYLSNIEFRV